MKLELKHLAAYAPFKIKGFVGNTQRDLTTISIDSKFIFVTSYKGSSEKNMIGIDQFKPILRPLSDLTKEIEVNGEKFVPNYNSDFKYFTPYELSYFIESIPNGLNYNQMQKLLEWHFDIFGLIDNGLAIDINTIK